MSVAGVPRTPLDKLWDAHVVAEVAPGVSPLHVALSREALLEGLDPIAMTLRREPEIAAFEGRDSGLRPWLHQRG